MDESSYVEIDSATDWEIVENHSPSATKKWKPTTIDYLVLDVDGVLLILCIFWYRRRTNEKNSTATAWTRNTT
jgi:hypothetical protein